MLAPRAHGQKFAGPLHMGGGAATRRSVLGCSGRAVRAWRGPPTGGGVPFPLAPLPFFRSRST